MNPFFVEDTLMTPLIDFNSDTGKLEISGKSIPDDSIGFYSPTLKWLEQYSQNPKDLTEVNIKIAFMDTSSTKCIFDIFKYLHNIKEQGKAIIINWYYFEEDDDMRERGEDFQYIAEVPVNLIPCDRETYKTYKYSQ